MCSLFSGLYHWSVVCSVAVLSLHHRTVCLAPLSAATPSFLFSRCALRLLLSRSLSLALATLLHRPCLWVSPADWSVSDSAARARPLRFEARCSPAATKASTTPRPSPFAPPVTITQRGPSALGEEPADTEGEEEAVAEEKEKARENEPWCETRGRAATRLPSGAESVERGADRTAHNAEAAIVPQEPSRDEEKVRKGKEMLLKRRRRAEYIGRQLGLAGTPLWHVDQCNSGRIRSMGALTRRIPH